MAATASVEVVGVKSMLVELRKLDPELRKQFTRDVRQITRPLVDDARELYNKRLPRGTARKWSQNGRPLFPWSASKARSGISVKISTSQRSKSVIKVTQRDPAASIIEFAGTENWSDFAAATTLVFGRTRGKVMWQAADRRLEAITREIEFSVQAGANTVNRAIKGI